MSDLGITSSGLPRDRETLIDVQPEVVRVLWEAMKNMVKMQLTTSWVRSLALSKVYLLFLSNLFLYKCVIRCSTIGG